MPVVRVVSMNTKDKWKNADFKPKCHGTCIKIHYMASSVCSMTYEQYFFFTVRWPWPVKEKNIVFANIKKSERCYLGTCNVLLKHLVM